MQILASFSKIDEATGRKYQSVHRIFVIDIVLAIDANTGHRLDVAQQPRRARMCGFGDKVWYHPLCYSTWQALLTSLTGF
jgi:hypothetical protein